MIREPSGNGFTLIEMSIVLVIIGLIVGGILTGRDLIRATENRAQIAQIEKYNTAVRTFQNKYGGLPGDLQLSAASGFGFITASCGGGAGARDGNGIIEGFWGNYPNNEDQFLGETGMFWEDLSQAGLVDGAFPSGGATARSCDTSDTTLITLASGAYSVSDFIPVAKIGNGNFVYVYTGSTVTTFTYPTNTNNWFGVSQVTGTATNGWTMESNPGMSVLQAYTLDKKVDDGLPLTGSVIAFYSTGNGVFSAPTAASPDNTTCYDTTLGQYSTNQNNGSGINCALSFRFQ